MKKTKTKKLTAHDVAIRYMYGNDYVLDNLIAKLYDAERQPLTKTEIDGLLLAARHHLEEYNKYKSEWKPLTDALTNIVDERVRVVTT